MILNDRNPSATIIEVMRCENENLLKPKWRQHVTRKERLLVNTIDVEQECKVIGLDLAKNDTSCGCITEPGEIITIDHLRYGDLLE